MPRATHAISFNLFLRFGKIHSYEAKNHIDRHILIKQRFFLCFVSDANCSVFNFAQGKIGRKPMVFARALSA